MTEAKSLFKEEHILLTSILAAISKIGCGTVYYDARRDSLVLSSVSETMKNESTVPLISNLNSKDRLVIPIFALIHGIQMLWITKETHRE